MTGIRDVARRAGVSTATVTRALADDPRVTAHTKALVLSAADELAYVPNAAARALTLGRSRLLGLFVPDIANPFYGELAQGMEDYAAQQGYHCVIASSHLDPKRELQLVSAFRDGTLSALAMTTVSSDARLLNALRATRLPLVFVDRRPEGFMAPLVATNNEAVTKEAVRRLIRLGHRRIGMLAGPAEFETSCQRVDGFLAALKEGGIELDHALIRQGHLGEPGGYNAMHQVLSLPNRPTAVFSFNNLLTVGALRAVRESGLRIPEQLSLVGFDDMSLFPFTDPPITAIAQPAAAIGREAARILVDALSDGKLPDHDSILPATIVNRDSWGPAHSDGHAGRHSTYAMPDGNVPE